MTDNLVLLKLGGSLITDKTKPRKPRLDVLARLAEEIAQARRQQPDLRLVIGHGAGSFAHVPAKKFETRQGVSTPEEWLGFAEVWWEAAALNRLVLDALHEAGLPVICLPPSAAIMAHKGKVHRWNLTPMKDALRNHLLPVIFGDVIFDEVLGGTILSTEDLFEHLTLHLHPRRILLTGIEAGVWEDYPHCTRLITSITPSTYQAIAPSLLGSNATDVTGGMTSKVQQNVNLVQKIPGLEVHIFSGMEPGNLQKALAGEITGTLIHV